MAAGGEPHPNQPGPENRPGILSRINSHVNWPATLLASTVFTIGGNVALHETDWSHGSFLDKAKESLTWEDGHTFTESVNEGSHTRHFISTDHREVESRTAHTSFVLRGGQQRYAREFSQDPNAGLFNDPQAIDRVVQGLKRIERQHGQIRAIVFRGYASAEDESKAADGGLTTPSTRNQSLAERRSVIVQEDVKAKTSADPALAKPMERTHFVLDKPVEQELRPAQYLKVAKAASRTGFKSPSAMVDAWNLHPRSVPASDRELLDHLLKPARKVTVDITWHRGGKHVEEIDKYCNIETVTKYKNVKTRYDMDWPIPIPLPLPIFRNILPRFRRRREEDEPELVPLGRGPAFERPRLPEWFWRGVGYSVLGSVFLAPNISGSNCRGKDHVPLPWLADFIYDAVRDSSGAGADDNQTFSFGIPFVKGTQLDIGHVKGNILIPDPDKACRPKASTSTPLPQRCSTIETTVVDGKQTDRRLIYQAAPISTRYITTK